MTRPTGTPGSRRTRNSEAAVLNVDGLSDYDRWYEARVQHYAFDPLALNGDDPQKLPLNLRKTT